MLSKSNGYLCEIIIPLASLLFFCGCSNSRLEWGGCNNNRYSWSENGAVLNKSHDPVLTDECVLIVTAHTRNFVDTKTSVRALIYLQKKGSLGQYRSLPFHDQGFKYQTNLDNYESWQIFTFSYEPGQYKIKGIYPFVGGDIYSRRWEKNNASKDYVDAKAGQYIYLGNINIDAISKRNALGGFFAGEYAGFKFSWDTSPEHIEFVRKSIPQLNNEEIIYRPVDVETIH